ncbi:hypothetical protein SELMODRAFT_419362 [Selaginella moellendorffii]|uniref:Cytidyltransferase-like domain-containing protein n=1 Tax=Selaginella moellendorffii TaxID=88036 RepID=D8S8P3_SELML|nr:hypothetical protein SELMODRAFT_419362 [Selaginella moellendorffii]
MKVVVVFDAKESGLPSHRESRASVDIVFAADACTDSWIKREVYLLRDDGCPKIRVITSDSLHQQVANGTGVYVWSCKGLIGEIKDVRKELEQLLHSDRLNYTEDEELEKLIHGNVYMVDYPGEGSKDCRIGRRVVLSGDFNPLHEGHLTLMSMACT